MKFCQLNIYIYKFIVTGEKKKQNEIIYYFKIYSEREKKEKKKKQMKLFIKKLGQKVIH